MKKINTFTIENAEQIEHFLEWRELYEPSCFKLFGCSTEVYHDPDDGKSYYKTIVDVFIRTSDDTEKMPRVPKDKGPDPVPQG